MAKSPISSYPIFELGIEKPQHLVIGIPYYTGRPVNRQWPMSSERDSFAKGIFSTFAKGFLLHKLLLKVNYSPLRVKKSRSHDMGQYLSKADTIFEHLKDQLE
jgi:hypothetical protein